MGTRQTRLRARRAAEKVDRMIAEITRWRGERPKVVRVNHSDYVALVETGELEEGKLRGRDVEVRPG